MRLYIIRHGQSTNNALADPRERVSDPLLTALGERQAELVAQGLSNRVEVQSVEDDGSGVYRSGAGITRLYASAMWRSLQTVEPIGRVLGLRPQVWPDICECGGIYLDHYDDRGRVGYPGATRAQILTRFPHYELVDGITEQGWWVGGFEEDPARLERAQRVARQLWTWADSDEGIAMVSHGDFISMLLRVLFELPPELRIYYHHYNTAISRIDFAADGQLHVRYLNRIDHLPPELVS